MAKKTKIPKKIAGVKVPKTLRRGLRDLAASQTGRAALAKALAAADAAMAPPPAPAVKPAGARAATAKAAPAKPAKPAKPAAAAARATTAAALEIGARAFTEALRRPKRTEAPPQATTPPTASTH